MIKIIAGVSKNGVIGSTLTNQLPWKESYPEDLKRFKELTLDSVVVMGKKTFESIGKPLAGRLNVVICREPILKWEKQVHFFNSLETPLHLFSHNKINIIGGERMFRAGLQFADEIDLTIIPENIEQGNVYFPWINPLDFSSSPPEKLLKDERLTSLKYYRVKSAIS